MKKKIQKKKPKEVEGKRQLTLAVLKRLALVESPNVTFTESTFPIVMKKGRGSYVTDVEGKKYLDFTSCFGVLALGHRHPSAINAIRKQSAQLIHGMGDVHPTESKVRLLETLQKLLPIPDAKTILSQSGGEAIDSALKTAMLATSRSKFLAFFDCYHGLQLGPLTLSNRNLFTSGFEAVFEGRTVHMPFPYSTECFGEGDSSQFKDNFAIAEPESVLSKLEDSLKTKLFAALVFEPIQGRGGERTFPVGFLQQVQSLCKKYGTLLIADEIFTGFWRTSTLFASQFENVYPDLICTGKALGGGFPLSACSGAILEVWGKSSGEARHTSTFLGHPLSCAVGTQTLKELSKISEVRISSEKTLDKVMKNYVGNVTGLKKSFEVILRGRGHMRGLWFKSSEPAFAVKLASVLLDNGVIALPSGADGKVLAVTPPLNIDAADILRFEGILIKSTMMLL